MDLHFGYRIISLRKDKYHNNQMIHLIYKYSYKIRVINKNLIRISNYK